MAHTYWRQARLYESTVPVQGKSVVYSTKPKWRTEARKGGGAATTDYIHAEGQTASESVEQQALFRWAAFAAGKYPELRLLYHVPNEGKRSQWTGARMRSEGLKSGVPDLCLPVARSGYHGLYIELKAGKNKPTANQLAWLEALEAQGYKTAVCYGWEAAKTVIENYLKAGEEKK